MPLFRELFSFMYDDKRIPKRSCNFTNNICLQDLLVLWYLQDVGWIYVGETYFVNRFWDKIGMHFVYKCLAYLKYFYTVYYNLKGTISYIGPINLYCFSFDKRKLETLSFRISFFFLGFLGFLSWLVTKDFIEAL